MWYNKKNEYLIYTYFQWHERRKQRLKLRKEQRLLVYEDKTAKAESHAKGLRVIWARNNRKRYN